jgi:hypothetical protein
MTISEVFQYCQDVANKDVHGMPFGPDQFNNFIKFVNLELFQDAFAQSKVVSEQGGAKLSAVIFDTNDLKNFIKTAVLTASTNTVGNLTVGRSAYPTDMEYPMMIWSNGKDVEIVSVYKLGRIRSSVINRDFSERPVAVQTDGYFEYYPNDATDLLLTYLKQPSVPYYDYCYDENDIPVFMPVGSQIRYSLVTGYYSLYQYQDAEPHLTLIQHNVTHPYFYNLAPTPSVIYYSLTIELEWDQTKHLYIAHKVLERMGINLRSPEVAQYAIQKDIK